MSSSLSRTLLWEFSYCLWKNLWRPFIWLWWPRTISFVIPLGFCSLWGRGQQGALKGRWSKLASKEGQLCCTEILYLEVCVTRRYRLCVWQVIVLLKENVFLPWLLVKDGLQKPAVSMQWKVCCALLCCQHWAFAASVGSSVFAWWFTSLKCLWKSLPSSE